MIDVAYVIKIPINFINYKNGKLPRTVSLRDRFGNMWTISVAKTGTDFYFQYGWEKFIEDNTVEFGDFFIFDHNENGMFEFKLLGITGCEKKGVGGLKLVVKEEGEMNVEHQKSVEPKEKKWASDSNNSSSDDDSDEDYMVEKEEEEDQDEEYDVVVRDEEEDRDEEEEEEENERADTYKKKAQCSKAECKRTIARKVRDHHDQFGADIFRSGRATQPKNPYFVSKIRGKRSDQMYVPIDVVRDYKLELPSSMTIRDSVGREFETKLKSLKDGRKWLIGGWRQLYIRNLVEKNDKCICEFVREKSNKGLYLQVKVLHEGASAHPSKKNKK